MHAEVGWLALPLFRFYVWLEVVLQLIRISVEVDFRLILVQDELLGLRSKCLSLEEVAIVLGAFIGKCIVLIF